MLSGRGLYKWADQSCRDVLPSVMCFECDREASTVRRPLRTKKQVTRLCMSHGTLVKQLINEYRPVK